MVLEVDWRGLPNELTPMDRDSSAGIESRCRIPRLADMVHLQLSGSSSIIEICGFE